MKPTIIDPFKVRNSQNWPPRKSKPPIEVISPSDFHEFRMKGIGGSDAPAVMNSSPWCSPQKLWELKTGRREPDPQNYPMRRGLKLEPIARARYQDMTGIAMPMDRAVHRSYDFIRANFDGINHQAGKILEIKCPGREDHAVALNGKIPEKYFWQCVHLMFVMGFDALDYFSFDGEEGVIIPIERNAKLERQLLSKEIEFWDCVLKDISPSQIKKENSMNRQGNGQRQPANGSVFTAREVVEILTEAKKLGVRSLKLPGFEAAFVLQDENVPHESHDRPQPVCDSCGAEKIQGTYGYYCRECYISKKENNERNQKRRW